MNIEKKQHNIVVNKSRRAFTKTGMAAPVILSLASRPSWATENCSFVQAMSGNISQHSGSMCSPDAPSSRSPGFYQGQCPDEWSAIYHVGDEFFRDVFGPPSVTLKELKFNGKDCPGITSGFDLLTDAEKNAILSNPTLKQAISAKKVKITVAGLPSGSTNVIVNMYVAAYLNAKSPDLIFPYTVAEIKNDWGLWTLFENLKLIQNSDMTVQEVNDIL